MLRAPQVSELSRRVNSPAPTRVGPQEKGANVRSSKDRQTTAPANSKKPPRPLKPPKPVELDLETIMREQADAARQLKPGSKTSTKGALDKHAAKLATEAKTIYSRSLGIMQGCDPVYRKTNIYYDPTRYGTAAPILMWFQSPFTLS